MITILGFSDQKNLREKNYSMGSDKLCLLLLSKFSLGIHLSQLPLYEGIRRGETWKAFDTFSVLAKDMTSNK